ncbi:hypothetical protein BKA65DRAFT_475893 [Rhexocercosporidium sp. MPI-PUGE-AT-0058]|nr:hypothetical protein BKA65DRAFT_475893 [Rhexocercosporidium sp. MPI-PUGE-AT-0058]
MAASQRGWDKSIGGLAKPVRQKNTSSVGHWYNLPVTSFDKGKRSSGNLDFWKLGYAGYPPDDEKLAAPIFFMLDDEAGVESCGYDDLIQKGAICVQIAKFVSGGYKKDIIFCLMLEPTDKGKDEYQRIGLALIRSNEVAQGWDIKTLIVV